MDYLTLGPVPSDESCEQVGPNYDAEHARAECNAYKHQLQRNWPQLSFFVKSFPHDFGSYMEVCVSDNCAEAFAVGNSLPATWDDKARVELGAETL